MQHVFRARLPQKNILGTIVCAVFFFLVTTSLAHASDSGYIPIVGIPGLDNTTGRGLPEFLNTVYLLTISVGALIAVVKISMAGVKYALSDIITDKSDAKKDIYGSLLGLAILLIPYIVLETINPNLVNLDVLRNAVPVTLTPATKGTGGANTTGADAARTYSLRTIDSCVPAAGKTLSSSCPTGVTTDDIQGAALCNGYFDPALNRCFTNTSSQEYDSAIGLRQYTSLTFDGWSKICGGDNNVKQVASTTNNNAFTLSCTQ